MVGVKQYIDSGARLFTKKRFDIGDKKKNSPDLDRRPVLGYNPMLNLLGKWKSCKKNNCLFFYTPNYQNDLFYLVVWQGAQEKRVPRQITFEKSEHENPNQQLL